MAEIHIHIIQVWKRILFYIIASQHWEKSPLREWIAESPSVLGLHSHAREDYGDITLRHGHHVVNEATCKQKLKTFHPQYQISRWNIKSDRGKKHNGNFHIFIIWSFLSLFSTSKTLAYFRVFMFLKFDVPSILIKSRWLMTGKQQYTQLLIKSLRSVLFLYRLQISWRNN